MSETQVVGQDDAASSETDDVTTSFTYTYDDMGRSNTGVRPPFNT